MNDSSSATRRQLSPTTTPPTLAVPKNASANSGLFISNVATRSPFSTPRIDEPVREAVAALVELAVAEAPIAREVVERLVVRVERGALGHEEADVLDHVGSYGSGCDAGRAFAPLASRPA